MRPQSKQFVVEVKRGTSRSAFLSLDATSEKFSSAELALFGPSPGAPVAPEAVEERRPQGRVLRSLIEPPPPVVEIAPPPRRGRKPGSKNKPKVSSARRPEPPDARSMEALSADARAFAEIRTVPIPVPETAPGAIAAASADVDQATAPTQGRRRLRERSSIIKRYVLGIEPHPGQLGFRKAKRGAKTSR